MSTTTKYKFINVQDPISVAPLEPEDIQEQIVGIFILMGPTGSGKSAFIESLSPDGSLSISKDSLDSVTQEVVCYRLHNVMDRYSGPQYSYILMDTPGFLDTKLSEMRIASMITQKLDSLRGITRDMIVHVCYFQPITDVRLGRSKLGAIKSMVGFARSFGALFIHVVTTMWNHVSTRKQMSNALNRLDSFETDVYEIYQSYLQMSFSKFKLTQESALALIDSASGKGRSYMGIIIDRVTEHKSIQRDNLLERINNTCQHLQFLAQDRHNATIPGRENHCLLPIIYSDEQASLKVLQSFLDDLYELDPASTYTLFPPSLLNPSLMRPLPPLPTVPRQQPALPEPPLQPPPSIVPRPQPTLSEPPSNSARSRASSSKRHFKRFVGSLQQAFHGK